MVFPPARFACPANGGIPGTVKQNALLFSGRAALVHTCHWVQDFSPARSLFRFLNPASERNPEKRDVPPFSGGACPDETRFSELGVPGTKKTPESSGVFHLSSFESSFLGGPKESIVTIV